MSFSPSLFTPTLHSNLTKCSPFYTCCVWGTQHIPEPDLLHIGILHQLREPEIARQQDTEDARSPGMPSSGSPDMAAPGVRQWGQQKG